MPTISVDKYKLYEALGQKFTTEEFEDLCFEFGIELDEDTENDERPIVNGEQEPPQLKIEIPANRYDMLCFEGIVTNLNIFRGRIEPPKYRIVEPASGKLESITVKPEAEQVRPYVSGAILRNIKFDKSRYESFISLQDKLHQNLARNRTLVSIGTHDYDTIKGPFTYEALPPKDIKFIPLNQTKEMDSAELMNFYENDKHLGRFLHIIRDSPVYPAIYDSNRVVCSLPPIINGDHSKITLDTTNVFIEITATDLTKLDIVTDIMVTMFSMYCSEPFTVEPVQINSDHNNQTRVTPNLKPRVAEVEIDYLNSCTGLTESPESLCKLLSKMSYTSTPSTKDSNILEVAIPPTRADVLHQCDVMEDLAVCYGYNNLPRTAPSRSATVGAPLLVNKLSDIIRIEAAVAGWSEVMPLILCSHDENFAWLNRKDDGNTVVRLANPKTAEYQVVRSTLLPGLLKTIRENKGHSVPMKIFEVSDVVFKDESQERKARNERHFAAAWYGRTSGFEVVHGLLDRVLLMLRTAFLTHEEGLSGKSVDFEVKENPSKPDGYWIEELDDATFFAGHAASVYLRLGGKERRIGEFGILHPTVLEKFDLKYPVSTLEINLEVFL
ncbi:phenylalanyl-tRNA synthetase, beta subunit [Fusarium oxysporum f. sp. raphani 54005]|uniref:Phenylalanine--tRNA ligase beta subunit n=11 Tax=Fusarium oxysporum TaxID=5507 RepID=A0A2H3TYH2_FUSOX|nr:phenylalanyl-tRNA synthetase, beta subunit [Fusarium oxysporum f. sp. lycopersici 4287]ENH73105.1 Phenylalanyl-tRNA synthetase beta chain [Fusarium oxysporum f. sp. cubense race 1]EWY86685.1 phenylalanyl-tRNA synthetase, beta subunit [Fusarium oxysporum NRRL 32931]EXA38966.1 phenylalanyl-tRNA synthetase, beta subunit [Fusarium oxysporum f. sp. pisi HDV247]EXK37659.1 phenylalanyl-tRNA synthetase, beta subunit [Fusarium oxysporum f. sp. melonis 26406]EXK94877.1 phenylalanyl-tRNA synthetase, b